MVHRVTESTPIKTALTPADGAAYERGVVANAEYFTVVKFMPRGRTERWEFSSLEGATLWAENMSDRGDGRDLLLYAVRGGHQALVKTLDRNGNWKETRK